ncbi:hypothetical protein EJ04DRAFT_529407 [Polyplosphaeria fusca]|uniref:Uncharacterized protein n=1 Tax=Polyplosphaeria fusca TaxID=682080 RepID=A0A9P4QJA5_9PLEO|nr:hypothetical protein EJ04DRAFT_529407 [Polyplosphaeria fusca]
MQKEGSDACENSTHALVIRAIVDWASATSLGPASFRLTASQFNPVNGQTSYPSYNSYPVTMATWFRNTRLGESEELIEICDQAVLNQSALTADREPRSTNDFSTRAVLNEFKSQGTEVVRRNAARSWHMVPTPLYYARIASSRAPASRRRWSDRSPSNSITATPA